MRKSEIFAAILSDVSSEAEIDSDRILSSERKEEVVDARYLVIFLLLGNGFQMQQDKCDIVRAGQDNTQRIIDTLNCHWQADLQQRYNDARLELSQQKQNAELVAALKPAATTA